MLQRFALLLLLLVLMGVSAMYAANNLGVTLPWDIAVHRSAEPTETTSKNREQDGAERSQTDPDKHDILAATAEALGGKIAPPPAGSVALDISRVSPEGMSVFAGRAAPDSYVTVLEEGKPAGSAKADSNGEWSIATEHKFASTDPKISFQTSTTPPPEEAPPAKAAAAKPPTSDAAAAAGDVMRKFETIVSEAREEARKEKDAQQKTEGSDKAIVTTEPSPAEPVPHSQTPADTSTASSAGSSGSDTAVVTVESAPRNTERAAIPVPLMFVYNEATLTPEGRHAADLLLEYLSLKHLKAIKLTGHADERGSEDYNYGLSRERLDAVARILKDGGYTGNLVLTPKGKTEPYTGIDRARYSGEALYQFDRRVELHIQ